MKVNRVERIADGIVKHATGRVVIHGDYGLALDPIALAEARLGLQVHQPLPGFPNLGQHRLSPGQARLRDRA